MSKTKYKPRFRPEVYMQFLNAYPGNWFKIERLTNIDGSNTYYITSSLGLNITDYLSEPYFFESGWSVEECLDQLILHTKFEDTLCAYK